MPTAAPILLTPGPLTTSNRTRQAMRGIKSMMRKDGVA